MLVRDYFERLAKGERATDLAAEMGIDRTSVPNIMKRIGYRSENKQWVWRGSGEEPLDENLLAHLGRPGGSTPKAQPSRVTITPDRESATSHLPFTASEIADLKDMLALWHDKSEAAATIEPMAIESLQERVKAITPDTKAHKTFRISEAMSELLDALAEREKVTKSDLLYLAIQDIVERYK